MKVRLPTQLPVGLERPRSGSSQSPPHRGVRQVDLANGRSLMLPFSLGKDFVLTAAPSSDPALHASSMQALCPQKDGLEAREATFSDGGLNSARLHAMPSCDAGIARNTAGPNVVPVKNGTVGAQTGFTFKTSRKKK